MKILIIFRNFSFKSKRKNPNISEENGKLGNTEEMKDNDFDEEEIAQKIKSQTYLNEAKHRKSRSKIGGKCQ